MKHISFPSIEQFRNIVATVNRTHNYVGKDDNGDAIYDISKPKPVLTFTGTVKLHGTNFGVNFNDIDGIWVQSRENIITIQKDNAGAAFFVESKKESFKKIFEQIKNKYNIDTTKNTISLYGEYVGKGIQKSVGIAQIPKSLFIFGIKISSIFDTEKASYWVDHSGLKDVENRIFNINDFKTYSIDIDFNVPQLSQNKIIEMTIEVEECCPVAKEFGIEGIGEGIVFCHTTSDGVVLRFKSKGERHQNSKVKVLRTVDDEKIKNLLDTAEKVTPSWRLEQFLTEICDLNNGGTITRDKLSNYIRAVINDIIKEDLDIISDAGLEPKEINKYISDIARKYFFEQEASNLNLL